MTKTKTLSRDQVDALGTVLSCFCDTWLPSRVEQWCEERGMTEDEVEEAVRKLQDIAGLCIV